MKKKYTLLAFFITITALTSFFGKLTTEPSKDIWYKALTKPSFSPPNWIFGIVWPLLYLCMAVAVWHAYEKTKHKSYLLKLYITHLIINGSWTAVFFGMHQIIGGIIVIITLIGFIIALMKFYWPKYKLSFYLMIPYFLWTCFALVLNIALMIKNNPGA
jgi:tryptophan-rich sensory protein